MLFRRDISALLSEVQRRISLAILTIFGYPWAAKLMGVMVFTMFGLSLWLIYLQAFVIREFCQYCLLSAAITTALLVVMLISRGLRG